MVQKEPLYTPGEVAALLRVDPKTVTRWVKAGKVAAIRTPGGHVRIRESDVETLLEVSVPSTAPRVLPGQLELFEEKA